MYYVCGVSCSFLLSRKYLSKFPAQATRWNWAHSLLTISRAMKLGYLVIITFVLVEQFGDSMFPCRAHLMWYCFQIQFLLVTMCHFISDFHRKDGKLFHYFKKLLLWWLVLPLERVNYQNVRTYLPWHINDLWTIFAKSCIKFLLPVLAQKPCIIGVNKYSNGCGGLINTVIQIIL